jgi:hypothetical protein
LSIDTASPARKRSTVSASIPARAIPPEIDPSVLESLARELRLTLRVAVGACRALGVDDPEATDLVHAAFNAAIDSSEPTLDRPSPSARLARLRSFIAGEFARSMDLSGIPRSSDRYGPGSRIYSVYGKAFVEVMGTAPDRVPPHVARNPPRPCGPPRPRDSQGRFVRVASPGRRPVGY